MAWSWWFVNISDNNSPAERICLLVVTTLLILGVCLIVIFYRHVYKPLQYFKRIGVPGPKSSLLTGNLFLLMKFKGMRMHYFKHLAETYGDVCGYYMFQRPFLVVQDPEFVKQVTIKEFTKFIDHFENGGLLPHRENSKDYYGLLIAEGEKWKNARNVVTPAFSSHKMKLMEPLIHKSILRLMDKLEHVADTDKSINVLDHYSKMTMEVILATAFGRGLDIQNGRGGELYESAKLMFTYFESNSGPLARLMFLIENSFPRSKSIFRELLRYTAVSKAQEYLAKSVKGIIEERRKGDLGAKPKDLLQLMMDANATNEEKLEDGQMVATAIGFLLGGYETTSNALSFTTYLLALNPEVQDRLANEIHDYKQANAGGSLYEMAQELDYLNMVFEEALRLYSPAPFTSRLCKEDCIVNGIPIMKGVTVVIPMYSFHRNPEIWPNPEKFDPERFSAEGKASRHPYAYIPFGAGPRSCIGMRLAILEAKMTLIEILSTYRVVCSSETETPLELKVGLTMSAKNGVFLKFERRIWSC